MCCDIIIYMFDILIERFPIFGGWKTEFYIGYSVPTELALFYDAAVDTYNLKVDFFTIFRNIWIEDLEIKVILPEGCTDIQATAPYVVEQHETTRWASSLDCFLASYLLTFFSVFRFTFLDSKFNGGRKVLVFKAKNIVEEHDDQILISYKFEKQRMLLEPLILVGVYFLLFCVVILFARTTSSAKSSTESSN